MASPARHSRGRNFVESSLGQCDWLLPSKGKSGFRFGRRFVSSGGAIRRKLFIGFGAFAGLIALFLVYIALQPSAFLIERSTTIAAAPAVVFGHVNDFHKWDAWSPWAKLDPNATNSFEGAESGAGAIFKWSGNSDVGEGRMTLTDSVPHDRIEIRLDFKKPFEDTSHTQFTFEPEGDRTVVTWTMKGRSNFIGRVFCFFMNMDKMLGGQFEKGLASLKTVAEKPAATSAE